MIVLEYVFDRKRGINSKRTEENEEEAGPGCEDVWVHPLDLYCWVVLINNAARALFFYSLYTTRKENENDSHRAAGRYSMLSVYSVAKNIRYYTMQKTDEDVRG